MKFFYQEHSLKSGIYKIINTHTNRIYVGQAKEFKERWSQHKKALLNPNRKTNRFLLNDFNKCRTELGHDDFIEFHVLELMENSTKQTKNHGKVVSLLTGEVCEVVGLKQFCLAHNMPLSQLSNFHKMLKDVKHHQSVSGWKLYLQTHDKENYPSGIR